MCGGGIGKIFKKALPVLGALAGAEFLGPAAAPLFGLEAGGAAAAGLGAGIGGFGGGLAGGEGLGDSLKTGAISGLTAGVGKGLFGEGGFLSGGGDVSGGSSAGSLIGGEGSGGTADLLQGGANMSTGAALGGAPGAGAAASAAPAGTGFSAVNGFGGDVTGGFDESLNSFGQNVGNISGDLSGGTAGGVGGGAAPAATGFAGLKDNFIKGLSSPGTLLSGGNLALGALKQGEKLKGERQLEGEAGQLAGQGKELASYLQSGTLPPGVQGGITQATQAAKAQIRSQYASRGMSGSSAEQADLARADQSAQTQGAEIAMQLLQQGVNESGLAAGLYKEILNGALEKDKELGSSFNNFAQALGGGGSANAGKFTVTAG